MGYFDIEVVEVGGGLFGGTRELSLNYVSKQARYPEVKISLTLLRGSQHSHRPRNPTQIDQGGLLKPVVH